MTSITSSHVYKQLKFIVSGGIATWATDVIPHVRRLLDQQTWNWQRISTTTAVGLGGFMVLLFFYVLILLPRVRGINPDYVNWRHSPRMKVVVPLLTLTIVSGWSTLLFSLVTWTDLGVMSSLVGSVGVYLLTFGLMGIIPSPHRR